MGGSLTIYEAAWLLLIAAQLSTAVVPRSTTCSSQSKAYNPAECLRLTKNMFDNPNTWWFGHRYLYSCNWAAPTSRDPRCMNLDRSLITLGQRLFKDTSFTSKTHLSKLKRILPVTYTSTQGRFEGCNTTQITSYDQTIPIYPGANARSSYHWRNKPTLGTIPECTNTNLCTIIFYDAGNLFLHNIWANYPKKGMETYMGPGTFMLASNPYVYLVFRQTDGELSVTPTLTLSISEFMKEKNLEGPIAVNMFDSFADPYALYNDRQTGFAQNCPELLENEFETADNYVAKDIEMFTPSLNLTSWMSVKVSNPRLQFSICCKDVTIETRDVWLDPIKNPCMSAVDVRGKPEIFIDPRLLQPTPQDLSNDLYSLMLVETLKGKDANSRPKYVVLHWLVANIPDGDVARGQEVLPFSGMRPRSQGPRQHFYYLLYKQKDRTRANVARLKKMIAKLKVNSPPPGRYQVKPQRLIKFFMIELSGISRFTICDDQPNSDLYNRYSLVKDGISTKQQVCKEFPNGCAP